MRILIALMFLVGCATKQLKDVENRFCGKNFCAYQIGDKPDKTLVYFPGLLDTKKALEKSLFDISDIEGIINTLSPVTVIVYSEAKVPTDLVWFAKSPAKIDDVLSNIKHPSYALGISMGGYNLAAYAAMSPGVFDKMVLVNPMLLTAEETPFDSKTGPALLLKDKYSKEEWLKLNPYALAQKASAYPNTLISSCKNDFFKLTPGAESFQRTLALQGFRSELVVKDDGCTHTDIPSKAISLFFK